MQNQNRFQVNFFYILLVGVAILTFFIFLPYFQALFLGVVLAVISHPFYKKAKRMFFGSNTVAALVTSIIVFCIIVIPLSILVFYIIQEAKQLYVYFSDGGGGLAMADYAGRIQIFLNRFLPANMVPETTVGNIQNYFNSSYTWIGDHFTSIFSNTIYFMLNLLIFLLSTFFFLRDGDKFREILSKMSPLSKEHNERVLSTMAVSIRSVIKGSLLVSLVQGLLISIGYWYFGISVPILWGVFTAISALLPGMGAFFLVIPISAYLALSSGLWYGMGVLVWSVIVVLFTDNILRPFLFEHGIKIHPLLIMLSVFGGIVLFGPFGFIIGPIALSLLFVLLDIHSDMISSTK